MTEYKIAVFGADTSGKSSISMQMVMRRFVTDYDPSAEDYFDRTIRVDGQESMISILDTVEFLGITSVCKNFIRRGKGFIIAYAINDRGTFDVVEGYYHQIMQMRGGKNAAFVICANKSDLSANRVISEKEGQETAQKLGADYIETSALSNTNIEAAFELIIRKIRAQPPSIEG